MLKTARKRWLTSFNDWKVLHKLIVPLYVMAIAGSLLIAIAYYKVYEEVTERTFPAERSISKLSRISADLLSKYRDFIVVPKDESKTEIEKYWYEFDQQQREVKQLLDFDIQNILNASDELRKLGAVLIDVRRELITRVEKLEQLAIKANEIAQKAISIMWEDYQTNINNAGKTKTTKTLSHEMVLVSYGTLLNRYLSEIREIMVISNERGEVDAAEFLAIRKELKHTTTRISDVAKSLTGHNINFKQLETTANFFYTEGNTILERHMLFLNGMELLAELEKELQTDFNSAHELTLAEMRGVFRQGIIWLVAVFCFVLAGILSLVWLLAQHIRRRLNIIASASLEFGQGNLNARAHLQGQDELAELASQFNSTADNVEQLNNELEYRAAELAYHASHDTLTGLKNRREFERRLKRALQHRNQHNSEGALCYMDLDQFKIVNDTCGHSAGDELLRQISGILQHHLRGNDILARLGGDEFAVLMERCTFDNGIQISQRFREAIEDHHFQWEGKNFNVTVSIGVIPINNLSGDMTEVMKTADAACYEAKDQGRNQIHVWREDDKNLAKRRGEMEWLSRINEALADDHFQLYIQPILPLQPTASDGVRFEVLVRLPTDKQNGQITTPGAFLPAAERYNLATKIDYWVVERTLAWLAQHPNETQTIDSCSINLSGSSLNDDDFLEFVITQLEKHKIPCGIICFEVTETAAISNLAYAKRFIETLKRKGCLFALDDFGSGLSSFAYLKTLPVDYLKIDGTFIKNILNDPTDLAMVKNIHEIGNIMGKETIAEFVENTDILDLLREIGINYVQGFGIGKPIPLDTESGIQHPAWSTNIFSNT